MKRLNTPMITFLRSPLRLFGLAFIMGVVMASGCSEPLNDQSTPVTISIGSGTDASKPFVATAVSSKAEKLSDSHSYLSKVTLQIIAQGYTTARINNELNEGKFTLASGVDALLIEEETFTIRVPIALNITFVVRAYNLAGYQVYSATSSLTPEQLSAPNLSLAMAMQVDIDPAVPVYAEDAGCTGDADLDGLCDDYENLFVVFDGSSWIADIDGDETPNYLDTDSDNDGVNDDLEGISPSNDGYPLFIHANQAPTAVSLLITTNKDTASSGNVPLVSDPDVGDTFTYAIYSAASNGTASVLSNTITYTPNAGFSGTDSFEVQATDLGGLSVVGTATVTVINTSLNAPVANAQAPSTNEDTALTITLTGTDADGDSLSYSIVTPPTNGSLSGTPPNLTYTPSANYNGSDAFTFKASDGTLESAPATVAITINAINDAPTAVPDGAVSLLLSSVDSAEVQANWHSFLPVNNDNGRFVAFWSGASNLVANDTNTSYDVFVRDTASGTTERATINDAGVEANTLGTEIANLYPPSLSIDGRYIVYDTIADNLNPYDFGSYADVFMYDRLAKTNTMITVCEGGGDGHSYNPSITPDGNHIVFTSEASDPWGGCAYVADTNGVSDIYLQSFSPSSHIRVSESATALEANGASFEPAISDDGLWVAFTSSATNLIAADTNGLDDIYLKDVTNGTVFRISLDSLGTEAVGGNSSAASISADGTVIAFTSAATNLVAGDTNASYDVFVHDTATSATTRVSVGPLGIQANDSSGQAKISKDGRFVVFASLASNLVTNDTNSMADIFIHDRVSGVTRRVSEDVSYTQANGNSGFPSLSGNGQHVVFASEASNLVTGDSNAWIDILSLSQTDITTVEATAVTTPDVTLNDVDVEGDTFYIDSYSTTYTQHGLVVDNADNTYTYTPDPGFVGIDTFDYTLTDNAVDLGTGTVSIAVNRANYAPHALDDTATTTQMTPVTIDVLANDFDLDGDTLSIGYLDVASAWGGFMSVNTDNTITFTPASASPSTDYFTYSVTDGTRTSAIARVTITINP